MLLLDTHVALWAMDGNRMLGPRGRATIQASPAAYFSSVTIMETTIKRMIGRWEVPKDLHLILREQGLRCLPVTDAHAAALEELPQLQRHDPFDRLLVAQALVENYRLLTADQMLLSLGFDWILDARP